MSWTPRTNCLVLHLAVPVTFECSVNGKIYARRVVPGDVHIIPQGTELAIHLSGPAELGLMTFDHGTLQTVAHDVSMNGDLRLTFQFSLRDAQILNLVHALQEELKSGCVTGESCVAATRSRSDPLRRQPIFDPGPSSGRSLRRSTIQLLALRLFAPLLRSECFLCIRG